MIFWVVYHWVAGEGDTLPGDLKKSSWNTRHIRVSVANLRSFLTSYIPIMSLGDLLRPQITTDESGRTEKLRNNESNQRRALSWELAPIAHAHETDLLSLVFFSPRNFLSFFLSFFLSVLFPPLSLIPALSLSLLPLLLFSSLLSLNRPSHSPLFFVSTARRLFSHRLSQLVLQEHRNNIHTDTWCTHHCTYKLMEKVNDTHSSYYLYGEPCGHARWMRRRRWRKKKKSVRRCTRWLVSEWQWNGYQCDQCKCDDDESFYLSLQFRCHLEPGWMNASRALPKQLACALGCVTKESIQCCCCWQKKRKKK